MVTSLNVANTLILRAMREKKPISPMKLQKLLYMTYACYYAEVGAPLFSERFEAWEHGPVVPVVYHEFKRFQSFGIDNPHVDSDGNATYVLEKGVFGDCLETVWEKYSPLSAIKLSKITHEDGSAWSRKRLGEILDDKDIIEDGKRWFLESA